MEKKNIQVEFLSDFFLWVGSGCLTAQLGSATLLLGQKENWFVIDRLGV